MGFFTTPALLAFVAIVAYAVYCGVKKPPAETVLQATFLALLFGPEIAFLKLPLWPPLDKGRLVMCVLFGLALLRWRRAIRLAQRFGIYDVLIIMGFLGALATAWTNDDQLTYGTWKVRTLPGLTMKDGFHDAIYWFLQASVPFLLGRWFFRHPPALERLVVYLVTAGLIQSLIAWIEIRFSPQVHYWVYGVSPAEGRFGQTMRWGGWRPQNFTEHGLALSLFMCLSLLASVLAVRTRPALRLFRMKIQTISYYLGVVLLACKSTGAIVYAAVLWPFLRWASTKALMRLSMILVLTVAIYPVLRAADLVPVKLAVEQARKIGEERAYSLDFRFVNERVLLDKALERMWFGWGTYGRNAIYDDEMGKSLSVADGAWIIAFGSCGLVGFVFQFGLLIVPVVQLWRSWLVIDDPRLRHQLVGFAALISIQIFDLLPNGLFMLYPFLLSGALAGFVEESRRPGSQWRAAPKGSEPPTAASGGARSPSAAR